MTSLVRQVPILEQINYGFSVKYPTRGIRYVVVREQTRIVVQTLK